MLDLILKEMNNAPSVPLDFANRWAEDVGKDINDALALADSQSVLWEECRSVWSAEWAGNRLALAMDVSMRLQEKTSDDED